MLNTIERRKAVWIGHVLRRKCLLKHVVGGKVEGTIMVTGRRGIRSKQLLDDPKEMRGYRKAKGAALDSTLWRTRFGKSCGFVRQTIK
jgi:hypothetical protein